MLAAIVSVFVANFAYQLLHPPTMAQTLRYFGDPYNREWPIFAIGFVPAWLILVFLTRLRHMHLSSFLIMISLPLSYAFYDLKLPDGLFQETKDLFWQYKGMKGIWDANPELAIFGLILVVFTIFAIALRPLSWRFTSLAAIGGVLISYALYIFLPLRSLFDNTPSVTWLVSILGIWFVLSIPLLSIEKRNRPKRVEPTKEDLFNKYYQEAQNRFKKVN